MLVSTEDFAPFYFDLFKHTPLAANTASRVSGRTRLPLAFVFDIDGVLIRGPDVLPAAKRALSMLEGNNAFGMYLTNGGGVSEKERCQKLTEKLGFKIEPQQYVQAHTILKSLVHKYTDSPVLVLGSKLDQVRQVAADYGFKKAYTSLDVLAWNPSVWPFHHLTNLEAAATKKVDFAQTPISAVFVFHDPRNWALDVQVICDVIQSGGFIGGPYIPMDKQKNPPELVFCNPDLVWRSDFDRPRLGQGAFKMAFQAVFKALTGSEYPYVQFGKPSCATYNFASRVLSDRLQELGHSGPLPPVPYSTLNHRSADNPESDIAGANAANWQSVLVKTGVYSGGPPTHQPTHLADDVEEAVHWAIARERDGRY
ncbi:HAD-like domain-containing protein [Mycena pura]|uniref:HAD-like domain-containing protein n=1 Tax=Mycena pura TaxID=153505 RepID=A0AAD6YEW5_9AGAR|nr:HAD-like domain-containing protein [Mycena pura]